MRDKYCFKLYQALWWPKASTLSKSQLSTLTRQSSQKGTNTQKTIECPCVSMQLLRSFKNFKINFFLGIVTVFEKCLMWETLIGNKKFQIRLFSMFTILLIRISIGPREDCPKVFILLMRIRELLSVFKNFFRHGMGISNKSVFLFLVLTSLS